VLKRVNAKGKHDVHHAPNHREGSHPGDQENRAAPVVTGGPEPEEELDDAPDQLQPPDLDLFPGRDGGDDVAPKGATDPLAA
jgi:hypothetical protein